MDVPDERSVASLDIPTDWSAVSAICARQSLILEPLDPYRYAGIYLRDREVFSAQYPVEHEDICWLGKNYKDRPDVWRYGCDRGCVARAAKLRR